MALLLIFFLVHQSSAAIFHLNVTEYSKMPELYAMDDYDLCLSEPGGTYCLIDADLYSDNQSELMRMIQEYSEDTVKHYNHTKVHRALCVTRTCKEYLQNRSLENEADLRTVLEECVDNDMWKGYQLNARLTDINYCKKYGEKRPISIGDYVVAGVYLVLIILNAVGTAYHVIYGDTGNSYLLAFSLRKGWGKLTAPSGQGAEPRLNRLQVFHGLRTLTMVCVYMSHVALVNAHGYLKNPYYIESSFDDPEKYILFNGTVVTNTFFVMSGFMLAYNLELVAEKRPISWMDWPKGMMARWFRLTPLYALVIFTVMTVNRHLGSGPLWDLFVTSESDACSRYWWAHLLYFNNYIYGDSHCFPQSWYLAADMQLYAVGLLLCTLLRKPRTQIIALSILFVVALAIPAGMVYYQNLGAVALQTPEAYRTLYQFHDTYRLIFVRGHTNLATHVLGISGGLLAYHWMQDEKSVSQRLKKYAWVVWLALPVGVGTVMSGSLFYMNHFDQSTLVKVLYAAVHKPFFQASMLIIIMGSIFKVENVYRGILEWEGFAWTARVSYAGFLMHTILQRGLVGSQRMLSFMSDYNVVTVLAATIFLAHAAGALLYMMVESPSAEIIKIIKAPPRTEEPKRTTENADKDTTK